MDAAEQVLTHVKPQAFKREWLGHYAIIRTPGKYRIKAARNVMRKDLIADESGLDKYKLTFRAILADNLNALDELFHNRAEVNHEEVKNLLLTTEVFIERGSTLLPMKDELVDVVIDYVGDTLTVLSMRIHDAINPELVNVERFMPNEGEKADIVANAVKDNGEVVLTH